MTAATRQLLGNGAHAVRRDEIARLRVNRTPIKALVARSRDTIAVPMAVILTASSRPEENYPDYGLAHVQGQFGSTVRWQLKVDATSQRWIEGYLV